MTEYFIYNHGRRVITKEVYDILMKALRGEKLSQEEKDKLTCECCTEFSGRIPDHNICAGFRPIEPKRDLIPLEEEKDRIKQELEHNLATIPEGLRGVWVQTITNLVEQHKAICDDENCNIQTFSMALLLEHILERPLTEEERRGFL